MKPLQSPTLRLVIYEGAGSHALEDGERTAILSTLLDAGHTVTCTGRSENGAAAEGPVASVDESTLLVLGRFEGGEAPIAEDREGRVAVYLRDITGLDAGGVSELVDRTLQELEIEVNQPGRWKPWFPVIDYDRCTNCMQCLSFCLFDVYGTTADGQIQVQNNDNCKTDCPACSRVCPEVAIMFPKYSGGPINGDDVREEDLQREAMKVDISAMLGGDLYSTLRKRSQDAKERFAKERDQKQAISERMRCLKKMVADGTIPASALKDLPSQDEIEQNAQKAQEKAQQAMAAQGEGSDS
jgi:Pyruvate/2-oxoacid:ferredoxin oxidoreductase delta subunit